MGLQHDTSMLCGLLVIAGTIRQEPQVCICSSEKDLLDTAFVERNNIIDCAQFDTDWMRFYRNPGHFLSVRSRLESQ